MLDVRDEVRVAGPERAGGVALLRFASALCASSDLAELEQRLMMGLGRIIYAPMHGLYILDPQTGRPEHVVSVNVGETFLARYERLPIEGIRAREDLEQELERARAALELTGSAVVVSDPKAIDVRLNEAARRLLAQVRGGEERVYGLTAPPPDAPAGFSRSVDVELLGGGRGRLRGYSSRLPREGSALVTVLELDHERGRLAGPLLALTPREREVAGLVVDGFADREIAERLHLSRHTVSQYVKRIYRMLGVDSRVALTRLLLGRREPDRNL